MEKKIFNHHKISRNVRRALFKKDSLEQRTHSLSNPYRRGVGGVGKRNIILFFVFCLAATGVFFLFAFHPFFSLKKIEIFGVERVDGSEIRDLSLGAASSGFSGRPQTIFLDEIELEDLLKSRFPLNSATVKKFFPDRLVVNLVEKPPFFLLDTGLKLAHLSRDGVVIELVRPSSVQFGEATNFSSLVLEQKKFLLEHAEAHAISSSTVLLRFEREESPRVSEKIIESADAEVIAKFSDVFSSHGLTVNFFEIKENGHLAEAGVSSGFVCRFPLGEDGVEAVTRLDILLSNLKKDYPEEYIDLTYGERVYWR